MESSEIPTPLTPAVFYILLALTGGEKHGYEIMMQVIHDSSWQVEMGTGTHYGSLKRMLADMLIEGVCDRPDPANDDERRRSHRLTELGRQALGVEPQRYARGVSLGRQRRLLPSAALEPQ